MSVLVSSLGNYQYLNGNYIVCGNDGGFSGDVKVKKIALRSGEELCSDFPDSIDLKITNSCGWGCKFCHESSYPGGASFDLNRTKDILKQLPNVPIEIAIGGGDIMECSENTIKLLEWIVQETVLLPRITINFANVKKFCSNAPAGYCSDFDRILRLVTHNVGVSISNLSDPQINDITKPIPDPILHVIVGIFPNRDLEILLDEKQTEFKNILLLGYKQYGRAKNDILPLETIQETSKIIQNYLNNPIIKFREEKHISFDNLAIEQLGLNSGNVPGWKNLYMGEEGKHSMYIDAVKQEFAKTSCSTKRVSWNDMGLLDFFNLQKNDTVNF